MNKYSVHELITLTLKKFTTQTYITNLQLNKFQISKKIFIQINAYIELIYLVISKDHRFCPIRKFTTK